MVEKKFLSNPNLHILGTSAAAVTAMTLMLSKGNVLAASGAGITTGASIAVVNHRNNDFKKALQALLEVLQKELGVINMNPGEYSKLIQQAREKLLELKRKIELKQKEQTDLNQHCNELKQQSAIAQQSLQLLKQNLQEKERETGRLNDEIATRQKDLEGINKLIKEALKISPEDRKALSDANLAKLQQDIQHRQNELNYLQEKYQEISSEKKQLQEEISRQEELKHNLKAEVAQLNAQRTELTESIKGLETREEKLTEEFSDLKKKKEELETIIRDIQEKNPNLSSLEQLQTDIEKLVIEKQTLTRQIADFKSQVEDLITKKEALK